MSRTVPVLTVVALAALIGVGTLAGVWGLAFALLVTVVVLASGWPTLLGLPTQRGSTTVLALCGAVATMVVLLTQGSQPLRFLAPWLAVSVIITFTHQLLRRDYRPRLVESVTGVVAGVVTVNLAVGWLATRSTALIVLGVVVLIVGAGALRLPVPGRIRQAVAVVAALLAAAVVAELTPLTTVPAAAIGLLVVAVLVGLDRLLSHLPTLSSRAAGLAAGAAVVASTGMVVYLTELTLQLTAAQLLS